ncbi:uncharacterized protein LOC129602598 [Paramacrobiotus metropolitanus]|uniref:uncharacterized protein LOC129602598 n=1 Tax=Paramacrobiotus metropolitanus TaxID=2943436 RepID=UPI0024459BDC|nr:uncharacterized protein LOC129602598 [Paramacrobiotus metropolitanus]
MAGFNAPLGDNLVKKDVPRLTQHFADAQRTCVQIRLSSEQRQQLANLEQRVRSYQGSDPLSVWLNYIEWIDKNCPDRDDANGALYNNLKNVCRKFYSEGRETKKYFDDPRYVGLWMKFISFTNATSTLQFMYEHGIGTTFPELYTKWAEELELTNDLQEARKVLERGIEACSIHPAKASVVQAWYKEFLSRHTAAFPDLSGERILKISRDIQSDTSPCYSLGSQGSDHARCESNERKVEGILDNTRASRTTFGSDALEYQPSGRSLADSAYGASISDRFTGDSHVTSSKPKKPRDSLCIKRYEGLHVARLSALGASVPMEESTEEEESVSEATPGSEKAHVVDTTDSEWSNLLYADPSRNKGPTAATVKEICPGPPDGSAFMWNHCIFSSGNDDERSFEENLADIYRKSAESRKKTLLEELNDLRKKASEAGIFERSFREMTDKCEKAEVRLRAAENQRRLLEDHCRKTESQLHTTEYQLKLATERKRSLEDMLYRSEQIIVYLEKLLHNLHGCLAQMRKDINNDDINVNDVILNLCKNLQHKLDTVSTDQTTGELIVLEIIRSVVSDLSHASEDRKLRHSVAVIPQPNRLQTVTEKNEVGWESELTESELASKENIVRSSISSSSSVNHQRNSAEQSNPYIRAMWNQTLNTTSARDAFPRLSDTQPDVIVHQETVSSVTVMARSVSEVDGMVTALPIRQSLAPRKSAKVMHTSAFQDPENVPVVRSEVLPKADFSIFRDSSSDPPMIPRVEGKSSENADQPADDDRENTPPIESGPLVASPRHVAGVLNDSLEHPGIPPDRLADKDFIEVIDSDSEKEAEIVPEKPVGISPEPQTLTVGKTGPRKSIITGFIADASTEFDSTFSGRKSIGFTDQTLPYIPQSEAEFFRNIDHQKRMASTPLVTTITEEGQKHRLQPRLSYLPPKKP